MLKYNIIRLTVISAGFLSRLRCGLAIHTARESSSMWTEPLSTITASETALQQQEKQNCGIRKYQLRCYPRVGNSRLNRSVSARRITYGAICYLRLASKSDEARLKLVVQNGWSKIVLRMPGRSSNHESAKRKRHHEIAKRKPQRLSHTKKRPGRPKNR